jgi:acyl carrier protein
MDTINEVKRVIAQVLKVPVEQLSDDTRLQDLGADSVDTIEIIFQLEEKFDVELTVKMGKTAASGNQQEQLKLEDLATVGDLSRTIDRLVSAKDSK